MIVQAGPGWLVQREGGEETPLFAWDHDEALRLAAALAKQHGDEVVSDERQPPAGPVR